MQPLLFQIEPTHPRIDPLGDYCTPATPGSGPIDTFCKTCKHKTTVQRGDYFYLACDLMGHAHTGTRKSDIRASWPACLYYQPKEGAPTQ